MLRCGLALGLFCLMARIGLAGATISLVPAHPGPYLGGESFTVDVLVSQDTGVLKLLRAIQLDFSDTDPALEVSVDSFERTEGHILDMDLGPDSFGPNTASMVYFFTDPSNLGPNPHVQINLPADGSAMKVATLNVTMPLRPGMYVLDVMNRDTVDVNLGAIVFFGFGLEPNDPVTILRPGAGLPGGVWRFDFEGKGVRLVSSYPACGQSLCRIRRSFIILTFDGPIGLPGPGEVQVLRLADGGQFSGPDSSSDFTFSLVEENVLRMQEVNDPHSNLVNRAWYTVVSNGWTDVAPFRVDLLVQRGDISNDNRTSSIDMSLINSAYCVALGCGDDRREDLNGDRRISSADRSFARAFLYAGVRIPTKPSGHHCYP